MRIKLVFALVVSWLGLGCDGGPSAEDAAPERFELSGSELQLAAAGTGSASERARPTRCSRNNGGCEQICRQSARSVVCECEPGAYLKPDRRSCWSWHAPVPVENFAGGDATEPRIATDPQGRATAVWMQTDSTGSFIWSSRTSGPSSGWSAAVSIDGAEPRGGRTPQLSVAANGDAVAVWRRASQHYGFYANQWKGGAWDSPQLLFETFSAAAYSEPFLSGSRNGDALVVWSSTAGRGVTLDALNLTGGTWTHSPLPIGPATALPTVNVLGGASGPNGEGAILWGQGGSDPPTSFINQYRNGQWGPAAIAIDDAVSGGGTEEQVAIVRGPAELVAWVAGAALWGDLRNATGWAGAINIHTAAAGTTLSDLQLVSDARGNAAFAIWLENDGARTSVWASRFSAGVWSAALNIEAVTGGNAGSPEIALDAGGTAVAVWTHAATRVDVWANRFTPAAGWGTAVKIEDDDAGDAAAPSIAVDSRGNARAIWEHSDGSRINVWSNHFE